MRLVAADLVFSRNPHISEVPPRDTRERYQWWGVTGTVGGFVLATVTTIGGLFPALFATVIAAATAYRILTPRETARDENDDYTDETKKRNYKTRMVDMGISVIRELAKAAPITVLFHTVGIDALSL